MFIPTEDTTPPSHFHEMGPVRVVTDASGQKRRVIEWIPIVDLETAREIVAYEIRAEADAHQTPHAIADHVARLLDQVAGAIDLDALVAIDTSLPPVVWPDALQDRTLHTPTQVETL